MKRARRALDGLDDEIRDHIERETQDNLTGGWHQTRHIVRRC